MAGGTFTMTAKKIRPGTYINFESEKQNVLGAQPRGIVMMPLVSHNYGPAKEFIEISASSPDSCYDKLGYSIYDDDPKGNMLLIREALKSASKVIVFIPTIGAKATATVGETLTVTAKYGGSLGNSIKVAIVADAALGEEYFDFIVYLNDRVVDRVNGVKTDQDIVDAALGWVDVTTSEGTTTLSAQGATALDSGTDGTMDNKDFTDMLDLAESEQFNVFCFPYKKTDYETLFTAIKSKIQYLRESVGKTAVAVLGNFTGADYEGIINVTNGVILEDDTEITAEKACAWVAGAEASSTYTDANTYRAYPNAKRVLGPKTHEQAEVALRNGEVFFIYDSSYAVVIEQDINSLTTITKDKDDSYKKNRVIRVHDTLKELLESNFPPNKFDNDRTGWDVMEGIGRTILQTMEGDGAITNVDLEADFLVDTKLSQGDETYINVGIQPVDSAEKIFFTVKTR